MNGFRNRRLLVAITITGALGLMPATVNAAAGAAPDTGSRGTSHTVGERRGSSHTVAESPGGSHVVAESPGGSHRVGNR
ncbi:hypothetical protein [Nocardia vermiculata]|uniref:Uncharacterized protein n=1 Tax=Nocardia vermiculata TaxID=257274 RepID=A0A846Y119_9NOCA|nr:hypothetical protein [Nocardia vermiculata]NKY51845.1 hypothetical protein [Nocardia vermiculata]